MNVGVHEIDDSYHHISFYPIQEGVLSLSGFLYPLYKRRIHIEEIYTTSNSLTGKKGIVRVDEGSFFMCTIQLEVVYVL